MTESTSEIDSKPKGKRKKSSGFVSTLIILMLLTSFLGGVFGFLFGKRSLEGVNPTPLGGKKLNVIPKPTLSPPKSAPKIAN